MLPVCEAEGACGQRQYDRCEEADRAGPKRLGRRHQGRAQQHRASGDRCGGCEDASAADDEAKGHGQRVPGAAAVPASVEDESEKHAERYQGQSKHIALALI